MATRTYTVTSKNESRITQPCHKCRKHMQMGEQIVAKSNGHKGVTFKRLSHQPRTKHYHIKCYNSLYI